MQQHQLCDWSCYRAIRLTSLVPVYEALGQSEVAALLGLNVFSGAGNTEVVSGRSKVAFFSYSFRNARDDSNEISALTSLGTMPRPNDVISDGFEECLCKVYLPGIKSANVEKLRWWLFTKKQAPFRVVGTSQRSKGNVDFIGITAYL